MIALDGMFAKTHIQTHCCLQPSVGQLASTAARHWCVLESAVTIAMSVELTFTHSAGVFLSSSGVELVAALADSIVERVC